MNTRKLITRALVPGAVLLAIVVIGGLMGYRLNTTASMPLGLWKQGDTVHRGAYATACIDHQTPTAAMAFERNYLPEGECPSGYAPLLKQIVAMPGDTVTLTDDAVIVNGKPIPNTRTNRHDSKGRPMQFIERGTYTVAQGEYWLIANQHPNSYDSRYFGPVRASAILSTMLPVVTKAYPTST